MLFKHHANSNYPREYPLRAASHVRPKVTANSVSEMNCYFGKSETSLDRVRQPENLYISGPPSVFDVISRRLTSVTCFVKSEYANNHILSRQPTNSADKSSTFSASSVTQNTTRKDGTSIVELLLL